MSDMLKAEKDFLGFIGDSMTGNIRKNKLFVMANELRYLPDNFLFGSNQRAMRVERNRLFRYDNLYLLHTLGENYATYTVLSAQLKHMKIDVNGEKKSFWDLYEIVGYNDNNEIVPKEEATQPNYTIRWTGPKRLIKEGTEIKEYFGLTPREIKRMKAVSARMFGDYRKDELTALNMKVATKVIIVLKNYFTRIMLNNFNKLTLSEDLGYYTEALQDIQNLETNPDNLPVYEWRARVIEGKWMTLAKAVSIFFKMSSNKESPLEFFKKLEPEQKLNLLDALVTLGMLLFTMMIGALLLGDADDDDPLKKWWTMYMQDNAAQAYHLVDLARSLTTISQPVVVKKTYDTIDSFFTMMFASMNYTFGDENEAFTRNDDLKGWNTFKKSIPYASWYFTFMNKYEKLDWNLF
jgi:hypothetical protein